MSPLFYNKQQFQANLTTSRFLKPFFSRLPQSSRHFQSRCPSETSELRPRRPVRSARWSRAPRAQAAMAELKATASAETECGDQVTSERKFESGHRSLSQFEGFTRSCWANFRLLGCVSAQIPTSASSPWLCSLKDSTSSCSQPNKRKASI